MNEIRELNITVIHDATQLVEIALRLLRDVEIEYIVGDERVALLHMEDNLRKFCDKAQSTFHFS